MSYELIRQGPNGPTSRRQVIPASLPHLPSSLHLPAPSLLLRSLALAAPTYLAIAAFFSRSLALVLALVTGLSPLPSSFLALVPAPFAAPPGSRTCSFRSSLLLLTLQIFALGLASIMLIASPPLCSW